MDYQSLLSSGNWADDLGYSGAPYRRRCPESSNSDHQFFSLWAYRDDPKDDAGKQVVAAFCEPSYWKKRVRLSVSVQDDITLGAAKPLAARQQVSDDEFNRTTFENLLGWGQPDSEYCEPKDFAFYRRPQDSVRLNDTAINRNKTTFRKSVMLSFALANDIRPPETYGSVEVMEEVYQRAHRYLFSLAINSLLENNTANLEDDTATMISEATVITVCDM